MLKVSHILSIFRRITQTLFTILVGMEFRTRQIESDTTQIWMFLVDESYLSQQRFVR